jgi:hypothetical protein
MIKRIVPILGAFLVLGVSAPVLAYSRSPLVVARIFRAPNREVESLLRQIERGTDSFRTSVDRALDRGRLDGTNREDRFNSYIKDFERATDRLLDRFDENRSVAGDVQNVLDQGRRIDRTMPRRGRDWDAANRDWERVSRDLRELARITPGVRY